MRDKQDESAVIRSCKNNKFISIDAIFLSRLNNKTRGTEKISARGCGGNKRSAGLSVSNLLGEVVALFSKIWVNFEAFQRMRSFRDRKFKIY